MRVDGAEPNSPTVPQLRSGPPQEGLSACVQGYSQLPEIPVSFQVPLPQAAGPLQRVAWPGCFGLT